MFLKWIKPLDPDRISSFIAKTIMFWTCEEFPSSHEMWYEDLDSMLHVLTYLFFQAKEAFEKHNLPYFFINTVNVIENIPKDIANIASVRITELLKNLVSYLPFPMEKELNAVKQLVHAVKSSIKLIDELKANNFAIISRRPELLKSTSFSEVVLLFADKILFGRFLQNPSTKSFLKMYNAIGRDMRKVLDSEKRDRKVSGDKKGEIMVTLGQGLLSFCMEVGQSAQQWEHQSEKSKDEKEDEQASEKKGKDIAKKMLGNWLKFFEE